MNSSSLPVEKSHIPPEVTWTFAGDCIGIKTSLDESVVSFVADGYLNVRIPAGKKLSLIIARMPDALSLQGQIDAAVWDRKLLRPPAIRLRRGVMIRVYCHGVFRLSGHHEVLVLVGREPPAVPPMGVDEAAKAFAVSVCETYRQETAAYEEAVARERERLWKENEELSKANPELARVLDLVDTFSSWQRRCDSPSLPTAKLMPYLRQAILIKSLRNQPQPPPQLHVAQALIALPAPPPRDGAYDGIAGFLIGKKYFSLLTWQPYRGLPAYPEIRWAVQRRLPRALARPRLTELSPLKIQGKEAEVAAIHPVTGIDVDADAIAEALDGIWIEPSDTPQRIEEVRRELRETGLDALAWYQPWHIWTEDTWGIYIDARRLDNLALSLAQDLWKHASRGGAIHALAAQLALGMVYVHEMFHATVEAALSWIELSAGAPKCLKYKRDVYNALRETPDWLEEALANWSAWDWAQRTLQRPEIAAHLSSVGGAIRVVETTLDMSPAGYRDWRKGNKATAWRLLANQLANGTPQVPSRTLPLPLESKLSGPFPYDMQRTDIPLRFVGDGLIVDRLAAHPSTFHLPSLHEFEQALKYFDFKRDKAGGKGSHEKWTGPDNRAFPVPRRDPVGTKVFREFLHHMGIDKATYVDEVRPNL